MQLLSKIKDLTERVKANIRMFDNEYYLDVYLVRDYFNLVAENPQAIRSPYIAPDYLALQKIMLDILYNIEVNNERYNLYNSAMVYNASCTEEDLHYFLNIPYGGKGDIEHLCIHTGKGNNTSDFDAKQQIQLAVKSGLAQETVFVGPKIEVKDYKDLKSAKEHFVAEAETTKYHDANHAFIHLIDTNIYFIAANKKDADWFVLANTSNIKHYRKQVILWMGEDGFLNVKFRQ